MPRQTATDGTARPTAAAINARIRLFCAGRLVWSRDDLANLRTLQAAYLEALRIEAVLSRTDVTEVA